MGGRGRPWSEVTSALLWTHSVFAFHPGSICYEELHPQNVFCFFWIWLDKIIAARAVSTRAWVLTSRDKLSHSRLISQLHRQVIVPSGNGRMSRCGHLGRGIKRFGDTLLMTGSLGFFRRPEANETKQSWSIRVCPCSSLTCPWRGSTVKSLPGEQILPLANPRLQSIPFPQDAIPREILGLESNCLNSSSAPGRGTGFPLRFSLLLPGCLRHHQKLISSWSWSWMACPLGIHWRVECLDWGKEHFPGLLSRCHS